ncbi:hypothetical protein SUGI_0586080 [Cryptomeria japonica]|nr:hypothetical protein SUGI_0586080 [Cryptomeria japonica]
MEQRYWSEKKKIEVERRGVRVEGTNSRQHNSVAMGAKAIPLGRRRQAWTNFQHPNSWNGKPRHERMRNLHLIQYKKQSMGKVWRDPLPAEEELQDTKSQPDI